MGNHDMAKTSNSLTTDHFYHPYKRWENVTIVDRPIIGRHTVTDKRDKHSVDYDFVFTPYVGPGKLLDCLDMLDREKWSARTTRCVFAHQTIRGVVRDYMNVGDNTDTDEYDSWLEEFPPMISGHEHRAQYVNPNVYYPGNSLQHSHRDPGDRVIWLVTFKENNLGSKRIDHEKIRLDIKDKRSQTIDVEESENFDWEMLEYYDLQIVIDDTMDNIIKFKAGEVYTRMLRCGIMVTFDVKDISISNDNEDDEDQGNEGKNNLTEDENMLVILKRLVDEKSDGVKDVYKKYFN
jgi:hypothetical protein